MEKEREIGYEVINCIWRDQKEFRDLWDTTDAHVKDEIVNKAGKVAVKSAIPVVSKRMNMKLSTVVGAFTFILGMLFGLFIAPKDTTSLNVESAKYQLSKSRSAIDHAINLINEIDGK